MTFSPEPIVNNDHQPIPDPNHLLAPRKRETGATIGIIIILVILIFGALYLLATRFNAAKAAASQTPYIPAGTTTLPDISE